MLKKLFSKERFKMDYLNNEASANNVQVYDEQIDYNIWAERYLTEWIHRDNVFWIQTVSYFVVNVIVLVAPYTQLWGINLIKNTEVRIFFHLFGLLISFIFFLIVWSLAERVSYTSTIYRNLRKQILGYNDKWDDKKVFLIEKLIRFVVITMSLALVALNIILFFCAKIN